MAIVDSFIKVDRTETQVIVYYSIPEGINIDFDKEVEKLAEKYELKQVGKGLNLKTNVRDITFKIPDKGEKGCELCGGKF